MNICTTRGNSGPVVSHKIPASTTDEAFERLTELLQSGTWWQCMIFFNFFIFYFIKWYISLNVPERKGGEGVERRDEGWEGSGCAWESDGSSIGRTAYGRKHKSNKIAFPDHWATSHFNYFLLILFSLPFLPSYLLYLRPFPTRKDQIGWWVLFVLYLFNNGGWFILIRQGPPSPGNGTCQLGTRQDGRDRATHVEGHRPTCSGSGLCM